MKRNLPTLNCIVVKVGSSSLCDDDNLIDEGQIIELTRQVAALIRKGIQVVLVTSGAVAAGAGHLSSRIPSIENQQAAAAIGQPILMGYFQQYFHAYGLTTAQLLLTHDDFQSRRRYLSGRNTLKYLLANQIVPIINENDSISTEEIRFSDNDYLGALCTNLVNADLYVILSNIDGIADKNPNRYKDVSYYDELGLTELRLLKKDLSGEGAWGPGRGGIQTKLEAPLMAARYGVPTIVANSRSENILTRLVNGEKVGTFIHADSDRLNAWQAYIAHALKPSARITIDTGAADALRRKKASLLASGIIGTSGHFERGDGVRVCAEDGEDIGRGIVEYSQHEVDQISGRQSTAIEEILGYRHRRSVIHRDNMVIN